MLISEKILDLFIGVAYAAEEGGRSQGSMYANILLIVAFILIFYFLLWRPQSKRAKDHRNLVENLQKGDEIVTSGGVIGRVTEIRDDVLVIEVANNVELKLQKNAVATVLPKGTIKSSS